MAQFAESYSWGNDNEVAGGHVPINDQLREDVGRRMDVERQRLETDLGRPLKPAELSGTRNVISSEMIGENREIGGARGFYRTFNDPTVPTQWPTIKDKVPTSETARGKRTEKANPIVIEWAKNLDNAKAWPDNKSLQGFEKWLRTNYSTQGAKDTKAMTIAEGGVPHDTGHGMHGANAPSNLAPQVRHGPEGNRTTVDRVTGETITLNTEHARTKADLEAADVGFRMEKAFEEYLTEGKGTYRDKGGIERSITTMEDFDARQKQAVLHRPDYASTAEGAQIKVRQEQENRALRTYLRKANPVEPGIDKVKTPKSLYQKTIRTIARTAGSSNNPAVNIAGDVVGAVMDGVAFAANPNQQTAIDLALSGGQVVTNLAALGVAALPIPGARPGAYALMKLGDNIAHIERLWGYGREGRALISSEKFSKKKPSIVTHKKTSPAPRPGTAEASLQKELLRDMRIKNVRPMTIR